MSFRIDQLAVLNLATVGNSITAGSFVKSGGTSSQFLKADGTVDTNAYITGITSGMVTTALGYTPVPNTRNITINGVTQDLSVDRTWTISAGVSSVSGSGAGISVSPTTGAVVVSNTGVTSNVAGTGISVSGATGAVTITNTGVTSIVAGTGISISGATGAVTVTNAGVTSVNGSTGAVTGIITTSNYNSYSPTLTGTGASGTWGISITGSAANSSTVGGISVNQIFNNMGNNHSTYTNFNNIPNFGVYYVQGTTNGPGTGSTQFYGFTLGLGDEYAYASYALQLAIPRDNGSDRYLSTRTREGGGWGSWYKINAGYADSAGNSATTSQTNFTSLTVNSNTVLHAGNYNSYAPTLTGGGASGTWSINITGSAGSASSASSVPWTGVSSGTRTNYSLGFQPSANGYAGFYFSKSTSGGTAEDAGYLLIRGTSDNDVYTAEGITLVADAGWLTLAQRTTSDKGVRIMTGAGSTTRMAFNANGTTYLYTDLYLGSTNTRITASDATGYLRIYGSSGNYLAIGPYNNNGWVYFENISNSNGVYFNSPGRYAFDSVDVTPYNDAENSLGNGSYRWAQVYTSGWLRQYGAQGMYNQDYGTHFYSNGGSSWGITGSGGNIELQFRSNHQSTIRGYVYADTGNNIGFLNNSGSWSLRTDSSRNTILYGQLTVGQDIGYSSIYMYDSDEGTREIHCNSNRIGFLTQAGSWGAWLYDGADWEAASSVRAPIFYDSDNTAYYANFADSGTSINIAGKITTAISGGTIISHGAMTDAFGYNGSYGTYIGSPVGGTYYIYANGTFYDNGTIRTMWHSGNAPRAGNSLLMYYQGFTLDANTMDGNSSGFTYSVNAPFTGPVIRISETGYSLWFNAAYSGGGTQLAFRTRNGDSATLNPWRTILHDANYNSYSPTLTGGGASGTWSINITGSAGSASTASQVTINYNNDSNSTYQLLWGSGNSVYGTSQVYVNPNSDVIYARGGYISPSNPWGTADSAYFPNGITTAGSTNWVYGHTYLGNAPSNGSGAQVESNGRLYVRSSATSGGAGYASLFIDRSSAANNWTPFSFENEYGNHSWGLVARFHIQNNSGTDRPSIQFSSGFNNTRWSIGYVYPDDNFRITQDHGQRPDGSTNDGWGTERFRINADGTTLLGIQGSNTNVYGLLRLASNNNLYLDNNYGQSIIGVYASTRYQGVFAMGDAYKLPIDGTGPGNLYGLAWSHPNAGGVAGNLSSHGLLVLENGTFLAAISGSIRARDDMRAPIFYDSDNTGYYLNPAGTSNLYAISNYTRQGAFNMGRENTVRRDITSDQNYWGGAWGWGTGYGTWADAWKTGFSSWDIWGSSTDHPQGSGYVHAQGIISGQHYCTSDGSSAYGWMMVGAHAATENRYWLRGKWGGSTSGWVEMITSGNIGSQSVSYASTAGNTNSISSAVGNTYTWTGIQYFQSNLGGYCGSLSGPPLQAYSTGNNSAFFSFHKGGYYAVNMGLDADSVLRIGGWSAAANRWQLDMSGNMTVAGDVTAYSDARVKENVKTVEDALDKVLNLRGVYYNRTDSEDKRRKVGVIAQEILEVIPEVVGQDNDGMYNVSYGNIVGVLIEAIKEQQKQIDELKARLN